MKERGKYNILFLAQTPPPYHGQAVMLEKLLEGEYRKLNFIHVRLNFSKDLNKVGKFKLSKIFHLFLIVISTWKNIALYKIDAMYYPPAGDSKAGVIRDIFLLLLTRPFVKKTIFHIHPLGLKKMYDNANFILRSLIQLSYFKSDLTIILSEYNRKEIEFIKPKKTAIIPNGIEDIVIDVEKNFKKHSNKNEPVKILFLANLYESKGIKILFDACKILTEKGIKHKILFAGLFHDEGFEKVMYEHPEYIHSEYFGLVTGKSKSDLFAMADIFCFPTYYESENQPVVIIEAMQFSLPIITTKWRSIPELVKHGINGYLADTKNSEQIAYYLEELIKNKNIRIQMGAESRKIYENTFTIKDYRANIEKVIESAVKK